MNIKHKSYNMCINYNIEMCINYNFKMCINYNIKMCINYNIIHNIVDAQLMYYTRIYLIAIGNSRIRILRIPMILKKWIFSYRRGLIH